MAVCRYRSESDLRNQWLRWDDGHLDDPQSGNLTLILALGDFLRGNLRRLVRRACPGYRLVIVPQAGHWPGVDSFGDLATACDSLGWSSIEIRRDFGEAIEDAISDLGDNERLLVVLPSEANDRRIM
jgi:hypothetical protein